MQGKGEEEGRARAKAVPRQTVPIQGHFRVRARPGNERAGRVQDRPVVQDQGLEKERAWTRDMTGPPDQGRAKSRQGQGRSRKGLRRGKARAQTVQSKIG